MLRKEFAVIYKTPSPLWFLLKMPRKGFAVICKTPFSCLLPRFRYQDCAFLKALCAAVERLYLPGSSVCPQLTQLRVIHMMLTQHSLFLPTLLRTGEEGSPDRPVRGDSSPLPTCDANFIS